MTELPTNPSPRWYLAPLYSRGRFSPRLLMAWQAFYLTCWVVIRWMLVKAQVLNGVLIQPAGIGEIVGLLLGFIGLLLGLGTFQKVKLDGPPEQAPAVGQSESTTVINQPAPGPTE